MPSNILHSATDPSFADRLSQMLRDSSRADIAVGYFFLSGFEAVAEPLSSVSRIRILVGRTDQRVFEEVASGLQQLEAMKARADVTTSVPRRGRERLAMTAVNQIARSVSTMPQTNGTERQIAQLRDMIRFKQVEVRAYLRSPLHAKAYLCWYDNHAEPGAAVVGSSNFTLAGFHGNTELNVRVTGDAEMADLGNWFNGLWSDAEDISEQLVTQLERTWPLAETPPYHIYLKALYELYKDELKNDAEPPIVTGGTAILANFQLDAVRRGLSMVDNYGGCYIGDVVGLGKTFVGAELLRQLRQTYPNDGHPLIVCPAGLTPMWNETNERFGLGAAVISQSQIAPPPDMEYHEDVGRYLDSAGSDRGIVLTDEFPNRGPVLVDEAHNFRNNNRRYTALRHYLDAAPHKVVLLSATPQNLGPRDIYRQLRLFLDEEDHGLDIEPVALEEYFRSAEEWIAYNRLHESFVQDYATWQSNPVEPKAPSPPRQPDTPFATVDRVLSPVFIRRRRMDIADLYGDAEIEGEVVRFPEPQLDNVHYNLEAVYRRAGSFKTLQSRLKRHKASRYRASEYLTEDAKSSGKYADIIRARSSTANLMQALLFKRFESSIEAFRETMRNLCNSNRNFTLSLKAGKVPVGRAATQLLGNVYTDPDDLLTALDNEINTEIRDSLRLFPLDDFDADRWISDLEADFKLLSSLLANVKTIGPEDDDKLQTLLGFLRKPEVEAGKVLVFSESETTINYLFKHAYEAHENQGVERLTGSNRQNAAEVIRRFAPIANPSTRARDMRQPVNILLATDVVSEGQNLQDCNRIINYDLHWNPVRLIQRFGRIDRIGSEHQTIHLHNMWPDLNVDGQLSLTDRLHNRIQSFHDIIGLDNKLLSESEQVNRDAMYSIYQKHELPETDDGIDEIAVNQRAVARLQRLLDEDPNLWSEIANIPDGIRSALAVEQEDSSAPSEPSQHQTTLVESKLPRSPFGEPGQDETVVLMASGDTKRCYAVNDELTVRSITPAQFINSVECAPDTPTEPLPSNTNERVTAATDAFREELRRGIGTMRRRNDSRNRRFIAREMRFALQNSDELGLDPRRIRNLRLTFMADLPPTADAELTNIRNSASDTVALVRRLEALRERLRLNPPDRDQQTSQRQWHVVKPLCSDGLV